MAVLALAAGGAALGSLAGGGVLTSIGWTVGALLGQSLFGSGTNGPRLGDLTVQSSAYGTPIPLIYGTVRLAGNIIWSPGITERRQRQRIGKGGSRATTYRYSASLAVAFGEGPGDVVKLWFNDKLGFDATGGTLQVRVPGLRFRAYRGDETQQPDPLIVARETDGRAPAYRGTIYVVFEGLELEPFGNQIPNITALIATNVTAANADQAVPLPSGSYSTQRGTVDFSTGRAYLQQTGGLLAEIDFRNQTSRVIPNSDQVRDQITVLPGGPIVGRVGGSTNTRPVAAIDPISGAVLWQVGSASSAGTIGSSGAITGNGAQAGGVSVLGPRNRRFVLMETIFGASARPLPLCLDADTGAHIFGSEGAGVVRLYAPRSGGRGRFVQGEQRPGETDAWHIGIAPSVSEIDLWRIRLGENAAWNPAPDLITTGADATLGGTVTPAMLGFTSSGQPDVLAVAHDPSDNSLILFVSWPGTVTNPQRFAFKWREGAGIVWRTPGHTSQIPSNGTLMNNQFRVRERIAYIGGTGTGVVINAATGAIEQSGALTSHGSLSNPLFAWDGDFDLAWSFSRRVLVGRVTAGTVPLSGIVQALAGRAGLAPSDLSLASLTDQVRGYVVGRAASAREAIEPLAGAFLFDMVERDGQMAGVKRGGGVTASLAYADLLRPQPQGGVVLEDRAQDRELPRSLTVRYLDVARDYEPGAQTWQRPAAPIRVSGADGLVSIDLPVPLTATEARTLARRLLMSGWRERNRVQLGGTPRHLRLDPADVLSVTRADGSAMRLRLLRADLGADYTMRFEAAEEDPADYALTAPGDAGDYFQNGMPVPYVTRGFAPDLPLITDGDEVSGFREYLLAGGYGEAWRGAELSRSDDLQAWDALDPIVEGMRWGAAAAALPPPPVPWVWDDTNSLTVWMASGEPDSATDEEVLNWANLAALVTPATGAVELIQWRDAVQNPDGSWTLSRLLRGRRGTEDGSANRAAGDLFLILDAEATARLETPAALASATRYYRLRGLFDLPASALIVPKGVRGRAERPYSPVAIAGTRDGSNNLTVTWVRRTRVGGELRDFSGTVLLAEDTEAYEVEFLNGSTVVRTVTGLSAPTVAYTAAEQAADGITPGNPVGVRIYQMSARVGRGVPGSATV